MDHVGDPEKTSLHRVVRENLEILLSEVGLHATGMRPIGGCERRRCGSAGLRMAQRVPTVLVGGRDEEGLERGAGGGRKLVETPRDLAHYRSVRDHRAADGELRGEPGVVEDREHAIQQRGLVVDPALGEGLIDELPGRRGRPVVARAGWMRGGGWA